MRVPPAFADGETHEEDFRRMRRHVEGHGLELTVLHCGNLPKGRHRLRPGGARAAGPRLAAASCAGSAPPASPSPPPPSRASGTSAPRRDGARGGPPSTFHLDQLEAEQRALHGARRARRTSPSRPRRCGPTWPGSTSAPCPWPRRPGCASACTRTTRPLPDRAGGRGAHHRPASRTTTASSTSPPASPTRCSSARAASPRWGWTSTRRSAPSASGARSGSCTSGTSGARRTDFVEVFIDEGQNDLLEAMRTYKAVGFEGPFMMDHTPRCRRRSGPGTATPTPTGTSRPC